MKKELQSRTDFSSGKIGSKVISNNDVIEFSLPNENGSVAQYFNVQIEKEFLGEQKFLITNAGKSQYANGWKRYGVFYFVEGKEWQRTDIGSFDGESFFFEINFKEKSQFIQIAWYHPYTLEDYDKFIAKNDLKKQGVDKLNFIKLGNEKAKESIVFLARQHPGETMSSFFIEGLVLNLLKEVELLNKKQIFIFPLVNLNGVQNGDHRFLDKVDYNRSWENQDAKEVNQIKQFLSDKNVSMVIDVHGDEVSNINFARKSKNKEQNKFIDSLSDRMLNFLSLDYIPQWKRILKKVLGKSPAKVSGTTAEEYFENKGILAITLELSAKFSPESHKENGEEFVELLK